MGHPSVGTLHNPSVAAEALAVVQAPARGARFDAAFAALAAAAPVIVGLVGVQLGRVAARRTLFARTYRRNGVRREGERQAVVSVGSGQGHAERRCASVHDEVRFVPGLPRSVGLGLVAGPLVWGSLCQAHSPPAAVAIAGRTRDRPRDLLRGNSPHHLVSGRPAEGA